MAYKNAENGHESIVLHSPGARAYWSGVYSEQVKSLVVITMLFDYNAEIRFQSSEEVCIERAFLEDTSLSGIVVLEISTKRLAFTVASAIGVHG